MGAHAQPLPWHTASTPQTLQGSTPAAGSHGCLRRPGPGELGGATGTVRALPGRASRRRHAQASSPGDGKQAQVRLGRSHGWKTSLGPSVGPASGGGQTGGGQSAAGAQGAHARAAGCGLPRDSGRACWSHAARLPTRPQTQRAAPLPSPCGRASPQPRREAGAPTASSSSRLTSELEDQADQGDPSSNAVSLKPVGSDQSGLSRPLPTDFY